MSTRMPHSTQRSGIITLISQLQSTVSNGDSRISPVRLAGAPPGGLDAGGTCSPAASPCCPSHFASWKSRALPGTDVSERCWLAPTQYGRIPLSLLPTHACPHDDAFIAFLKGQAVKPGNCFLGGRMQGNYQQYCYPKLLYGWGWANGPWKFLSRLFSSHHHIRV